MEYTKLFIVLFLTTVFGILVQFIVEPYLKEEYRSKKHTVGAMLLVFVVGMIVIFLDRDPPNPNTAGDTSQVILSELIALKTEVAIGNTANNAISEEREKELEATINAYAEKAQSSDEKGIDEALEEFRIELTTSAQSRNVGVSELEVTQELVGDPEDIISDLAISDVSEIVTSRDLENVLYVEILEGFELPIFLSTEAPEPYEYLSNSEYKIEYVSIDLDSGMIQISFPGQKNPAWANPYLLVFSGNRTYLPQYLHFRVITDREDLDFVEGKAYSGDSERIKVWQDPLEWRDPTDEGSALSVTLPNEYPVTILNLKETENKTFGSGYWYTVTFSDPDGGRWIWNGFLPEESVLER